MNDKLKFYHEDIDSIVEMVKEELGHNDFAVTLKEYIKPAINHYSELAKKEIEQYIWETEDAVALLAQIQIEFKSMMIKFRMANENYKTKIYNMSKGFESDSQVPYNYNDKDWLFVIKLKE